MLDTLERPDRLVFDSGVNSYVGVDSEDVPEGVMVTVAACKATNFLSRVLGKGPFQEEVEVSMTRRKSSGAATTSLFNTTSDEQTASESEV